MAFHTLTVASLERETPDAVVVGFDVPTELEASFRFTPGQYLTLRTTIDGEEVRRSYSICSGPGQRPRVGIKKVEGGRFSTFANERLAVGDQLEVMPPMGRFTQAPAGNEGLHHVAFASGSGITPILAIVTHVLERSPKDTVSLFYGNRAMGSVMFLEELHRAKDRFLGRLKLHHLLSRESIDVPLFRGRLDREKVEALARVGLIVPEQVDAAYICGPGSMIDEVEAGLEAIGVPADRVRYERFSDAGAPKPSPPRPSVEEVPAGGVALEVTLDGATRAFELRPGESVIDAGARAGVDLPWSCAGGMCSTCRCKLVKGEAEMKVNYALEPWELERGYILACQAVPKSEALALDFDDQ